MTIAESGREGSLETHRASQELLTRSREGLLETHRASQELLTRSRAAQDLKHAEFTIFYKGDFVSLVQFARRFGDVAVEDAVDLGQEAMARAYRSWATVLTPRAWVREVVRNLVKERWRRTRFEVTDGVTTNLLVAPDEAGAIDEMDEVLRLLKLLPARQREVMAWHFDGFECTEIATALGVTEANVRSNLRHARQCLARHIGQRREEP